MGFEGKVCRPGTRAEARPGEPLVVLEGAGPIGECSRGKPRDLLWILWRYDWGEGGWAEVGRAQATNWEWAITLREAAWRALNPDPKLYDVSRSGRELAEEIMLLVDARLKEQSADIQASALSAVYDRVACRIANVPVSF